MNDRLLRNMLPAQECSHDGGVVRWQARESCEGDTQGSHLARAKRRARARESCSVHAGTHATHTHAHARTPPSCRVGVECEGVEMKTLPVKELLKYNVKEGCRHGDDRLTASGVNNALCVPHVAPI